LFNVGLARSYDLWGSAHRDLHAARPTAASVGNSLNRVALGLGGSTRRCAALSLRRDRRAGQQGRYLAPGVEIASDAGVGLAARSRWASRGKSSPGAAGFGWCRHPWRWMGHGAVAGRL